MNDFMLEQWNSTVNKNDVVFHLGDLTAGLKERYSEASNLVQKLNGKIYLIRGNHDHFKDNWYIKNGIKEVVRFKIVENIMFSHHSFYQKSKYEDKFEKLNLLFEEIYTEYECKYFMHGHSHMYPSKKLNIYNVSVDLHNFKPVLVDNIMKMFRENIIQSDSNLISESKNAII